MSSTDRDLQPRVAQHAPSSGAVVEVVDEETTGPIPQALDDMPEWAARQTVARRTLSRRIDHCGDRIVEHAGRLTALEQSQGDATVAAAGARMARQIRALLVSLAVLVPGAGLGAGKAFLAARDEAARAAGVAAAEQAALRHDVDLLRAEVAALTHLLRGDTP